MKAKLKELLHASWPYRKLGPYLLYLRARNFDRKHDVDTLSGASSVALNKYDVAGDNVKFGTGYFGVDPRVFGKLLRELGVTYEDKVFVDIGSGKGRALLLASEYPFSRIEGVEFVPELHSIAERNIQSYRSESQKCRNIRSLCMDAALYDMPFEPTVFFIFNPFRKEVMELVLANLIDSLKEVPREVWILYLNPEVDYLLEGNPSLQKIMSSEWYSVYRTPNSLASTENRN